MSGHAFLPRELAADSASGRADTSWVQYQAGQRFAGTRRFAEARLFYGPGAGRDQVLVTTDGHRVPHALAPTGLLHELVLRPGTPARRTRLAFAIHGPRLVYGVSFESPQGITLDNFSFRGDSGMSLTRIPFRQLAAFGQALDYWLIILHYGVNVANGRVPDYTFYERAMTRVVDRMQRAFPRASILIVGMSDKSTRLDGGYSDIAIGIALLLGYRLPPNFLSPYQSTSITEFWRRWHISLSSWLRDYLYILPDGFTFQLAGALGRRSTLTQAVLITVVIWLIIQVKSAEIQSFIYFQF